MSITVNAGELVEMDPSDKRVIVFDWNEQNLGTSVEITTSTWTITVIRQNGVTALTKDSESLLTGNRKTQVRLIATTASVGDRYEVANTIVTNETPIQQKEQSFQVLIENR